MLCKLLSFFEQPKEECCLCLKNCWPALLFEREQCRNCFQDFCGDCLELRHLPHTGIPVPVCLKCIEELNSDEHIIDYPQNTCELKIIEEPNSEPIGDVQEVHEEKELIPTIEEISTVKFFSPINTNPDSVIGLVIPTNIPHNNEYYFNVIFKDIPFDTGWNPSNKN